jgi:AAHS family benzoate transporter-like MFS transporter
VLLLAVVAVVGAGAHTALTLLMASVADSYPTSARASAIGWTNGTGRLGAVVAPALGGAVLSSGLGPHVVFLAFAVTALCSAVVVAALVVLGRRESAAEVPAGVAAGLAR